VHEAQVIEFFGLCSKGLQIKIRLILPLADSNEDNQGRRRRTTQPCQ
jgi:hypothetical protein